jgi:hypothetical protein
MLFVFTFLVSHPNIGQTLTGKNPNLQTAKELFQASVEQKKEILKLKSDLERLHSEIEKLRNEISDERHLTEERISNSQAIVSNSISSSSRYLNVVSVVFGLVTVGLGIYFSILSRKIQKSEESIARHQQFIESNIDGFKKEIQLNEAHDLMQKLRNAQNDFPMIELIYSRLSLLDIPAREYKNFKKLLEHRANFSDVSQHGDDLSDAERFDQFTYKILLIHFPKEFYSDNNLVTFANSKRGRKLPYNELSYHYIEICITKLREAMEESSLDEKLESILLMLVYIVENPNLYNDTNLLTQFKREFYKYTDKIVNGWASNTGSWPDVTGQQRLSEHGLWPKPTDAG